MCLCCCQGGGSFDKTDGADGNEILLILQAGIVAFDDMGYQPEVVFDQPVLASWSLFVPDTPAPLGKGLGRAGGQSVGDVGRLHGANQSANTQKSSKQYIATILKCACPSLQNKKNTPKMGCFCCCRFPLSLLVKNLSLEGFSLNCPSQTAKCLPKSPCPIYAGPADPKIRA